MKLQLTGAWATIAASVLILLLTRCHHDRVGDPAAAFALPNVRGGEFHYPTAEHHNLLIAFLQTQPDIGSEHNPSRSVVPFLMSMNHQYQHAGAGVDVIIVDETALATYVPVAGKFPPMDTLLNTSYEWSLTVPMMADPKGEVARTYGVNKVPTIILIDSNGRIAQRWERMPHPGVLAWGIQQLVGGPMAGTPRPLANDHSQPALK